MDKSRNLGRLSKLLLLATTVIWGSSFFILKNTLDDFPTFFVLAVRFSMGGAVIGLVFLKRLLKFKLKTFLHGLLLGLCLAAAYSLQTLGLKSTTPGKNAFLTAVYVIIVPFMYWIMFRSKPRWNNLAAAVLCLAGIGLVSLDGMFHVEQGDLLTLGSGVFYALQIVFIKRFTADDEPGQLLFTELITAALVFWIVSFASETMPSAVTGEQFLPVLYLGIVATGLAQLMQLTGQKHTSANSASLILSLEAVFGVAFSMLFYHEKLTLRLGMGFGVIFIAVLLSEINWTELFRKKEKKQIDLPKSD